MKPITKGLGLIHEIADQGFQAASEIYDAGRPGYPPEAVDHLIRVLNLNPSSTLVELGAGTGKFTQLIVPTRARIIAVEPVEAMRRKFSHLLPGVEILPGTAEKIPLPDQTAGA